MNEQSKYIDLRRDQYQAFFNEAEYPGVTWVFAFQKKLESYIQASGMLADANINNPEIPKLKDLGFASLMPELGPYLLVKYSDELRSLRLTLSQIFLFYADDLVKVEIRTRKDKTLLFTDETSIEGIQLENKTIESWVKHEALEIKLQLLARGLDRESHEQSSLIFDTEAYVRILTHPELYKQTLSQIKSPELLAERLKLFNSTDITNNLTIGLPFTKVNSYERFIDFLILSKYSNKKLLDLDNFTFDEDEASKLQKRLFLFR